MWRALVLSVLAVFALTGCSSSETADSPDAQVFDVSKDVEVDLRGREVALPEAKEEVDASHVDAPGDVMDTSHVDVPDEVDASLDMLPELSDLTELEAGVDVEAVDLPEVEDVPDQVDVCLPDCEDKECGDDGCGGACGECQELQNLCVEGQCLCIPACLGKECGDDGCEGSCGGCGANEVCTGGACECEFLACEDACCLEGEVCHDGSCCLPVCEDGEGLPLECGDDTCGGSCGECGACVCSMLNVLLDAGKEEHVHTFIPYGDGYVIAGNSYEGYVYNAYWILTVDGEGAIQNQVLTEGYGTVNDIVPLEGGAG